MVCEASAIFNPKSLFMTLGSPFLYMIMLVILINGLLLLWNTALNDTLKDELQWLKIAAGHVPGANGNNSRVSAPQFSSQPATLRYFGNHQGQQQPQQMPRSGPNNSSLSGQSQLGFRDFNQRAWWHHLKETVAATSVFSKTPVYWKKMCTCAAAWGCNECLFGLALLLHTPIGCRNDAMHIKMHLYVLYLVVHRLPKT